MLSPAARTPPALTAPHRHDAGGTSNPERPAQTPHLTSMDWTPSDSSSKALFSRGPSVMAGGSVGIGGASPSDPVTTERR